MEEIKTFNIAAVDDSNEDLDDCVEALVKISKAHNIIFNITKFNSGNAFLDSFKSQYDIIILDINLQLSNGIDIAHKIRDFDKDVLIFFVTNLAKYATEGYQVNAIDFILKPINYESFKLRFERAITSLLMKKREAITVQINETFKKVYLDEVLYLEVYGHNIIFYLDSGNFEAYGSLKKYEEKLRKYGFLRCHNNYLVNAKRIDNVEKHTILLDNGKELEISHPRKKSFMNDFKKYIVLGGKI